MLQNICVGWGMGGGGKKQNLSVGPGLHDVKMLIGVDGNIWEFTRVRSKYVGRG